MLCFFDTEFTGLHKNTTLISLGIVSERGDEFYAEFTDYDGSQVDDWIYNNVISHLKSKDRELSDGRPVVKSSTEDDKEIMYVCGNSTTITIYLKRWFDNIRKDNEQIQMVSDICHYDFVLFIDLFGTALNLPDYISPYCHDININISEYKNVSPRVAFDINREAFCSWQGDVEKHNALFDAKVIKKCWEFIHTK